MLAPHATLVPSVGLYLKAHFTIPRSCTIRARDLSGCLRTLGIENMLGPFFEPFLRPSLVDGGYASRHDIALLAMYKVLGFLLFL